METMDAVTGTIERAAKGAVSATPTSARQLDSVLNTRVPGERSDIGDRGRGPAGYPGCARFCMEREGPRPGRPNRSSVPEPSSDCIVTRSTRSTQPDDLVALDHRAAT